MAGVSSYSVIGSNATSPTSSRDPARNPDAPSHANAESAESVTPTRWQRRRFGQPVKKADVGNAAAVQKEMAQALRHSPDIIAKVGNSYKKRFKVASRVEMFPKLLEEIQKQRDAMKQSKRWDKTTDGWKDHIKTIAKPKFGGTDQEWKRWCAEILEPYADRLWDPSDKEL